MRVLVFTLRHSQFPWMSMFPHVRGHVLAKFLTRQGVEAEYRTLPVEGDYDVAICADYQGDARWLGVLTARMSGLRAARWFCLADYGTTDKPYAVMAEWFAARGGVLCHLDCRPLAAFEHHVGLGVDDTVRFDSRTPREVVLFDFPRSQRVDPAAAFARATLDAVRAAHPGRRLVGTGPADAPIRDWFDAWIPYGQPHDEYVRVFAGCAAFVPGCKESLGFAVAEAQVAGAAVVTPAAGRIKPEMLVPAADIRDPDLPRAIACALATDGAAIAAAARDRFCPDRMARRVLAAISVR